MAGVYKVVFAGPAGAGIGKAVRALSDVTVVSRQFDALADAAVPQPATITLDYGMVRLVGGELVHLYGTAGAERIDVVGSLVMREAMGVVVLLDAVSAEPVEELRRFVDALQASVEPLRLVVGITSLVAANRWLRAKVADALTELKLPPVVMTADAFRRKDLMMLLKALIFSLDSGPDPR